MLLRSIVIFLLALSSGGEVGAGVPEQIKKIGEETTLEICSIVEMKGKFVSANGWSDTKPIVSCGNSFLISQSEVLTNSHVIKNPVDMIASRFEFLKTVRQQTGELNGHGPKRIDRIDFYLRLATKDGLEYVSDRITYTARWDGVFSEKTVAAFLESISRARLEEATGRPRVELLGRDRKADLALLKLSKPLVRNAYFVITPIHPSVGSHAWGYALSSSLLTVSHQAIEAEGFYIGVNVRDDMLTIQTITPNRPGISGSAMVDEFARLLGVTTKISTPEYQWNKNEPFPCSPENPCARYLVDVRKVIAFVNKVRNSR